MRNGNQNQKTRRSGTSAWRERDEQVIRFLKKHPATATQLDSLHLFASTSALYRRLLRLRKRGKIRIAGVLEKKDGGRPEYLYCTHPVSAWLIRHESSLTAFLLQFVGADNLLHERRTEIRRGKEADDPIHADAEIVLHDRTLFVEMDMATESLSKIKGRFACYGENMHKLGSHDVMLFVTTTDERIKTVQTKAEDVSDIILFTTFAKATTNPFGEIWKDLYGETVAVGKPC